MLEFSKRPGGLVPSVTASDSEVWLAVVGMVHSFRALILEDCGSEHKH